MKNKSKIDWIIGVNKLLTIMNALKWLLTFNLPRIIPIIVNIILKIVNI